METNTINLLSVSKILSIFEVASYEITGFLLELWDANGTKYTFRWDTRNHGYQISPTIR